MGCPFCDPETIAKQKIFETENEYVFYNLGPRTKGQCLVVPKRHVESVRELDEAELASLLQTVKTVSTKLNDYLQPVAFNYGFNEGAMAGQTVPHLHFHIMPRYADDGIQEVHIFRNSSDEKRFMDWADAELLVGEFKKIF
ncbi:MAG: HIT family protein [Candidatus Moranbacteria bacterium]|nr:HIT family protein [Candidatus Moranbacteria bacterium]